MTTILERLLLKLKVRGKNKKPVTVKIDKKTSKDVGAMIKKSVKKTKDNVKSAKKKVWKK